MLGLPSGLVPVKSMADPMVQHGAMFHGGPSTVNPSSATPNLHLIAHCPAPSRRPITIKKGTRKKKKKKKKEDG